MLFYIFGEISIPNSYTAIIFIWNKIKTLLTSKQWKIIRTNIFFFKIDRLKLQRYQIIENKFEFQFRQNFCLFYTVLFIQGLIHMVSVYSGFSLHSTVYSRIVFTWFLFIQDSDYTVLFIQELFSHDFCLFRIQTTQYCLFKDCFHMISIYSELGLYWFTTKEVVRVAMPSSMKSDIWGV